MATFNLRQSSKKPTPPLAGGAVESPDEFRSGARTQEKIMMSFSLAQERRAQCRTVSRDVVGSKVEAMTQIEVKCHEHRNAEGDGDGQRLVRVQRTPLPAQKATTAS